MDDHNVISQAESDEEILTFDVSDEALERTHWAASVHLDILHWGLAVLPGLILRGYRTNSGSLAIFTAIRRASLLTQLTIYALLVSLN
jgi:hypothetical protein